MAPCLFPKEPKNPGAHNIDAAISRPRIEGGKITDIRLFLIYPCDREIVTLQYFFLELVLGTAFHSLYLKFFFG